MVHYGNSIMQIRFSPETRTFGQLATKAANYFGLPGDIVFLSDKPIRGCIYMTDMKVRDELFPMVNAMPVTHQPEVYMILRNNTNQMDMMDGNKLLKEELNELDQ